MEGLAELVAVRIDAEDRIVTIFLYSTALAVHHV